MEIEANHFFYVLECADQTLYAGYTNNLEKRVATHNAGKGAKYTRARGPVKCIYYETFQTKQEAMKAEYAFKQLSRKEKFNYIGEKLNEITKK
ncbi:endonuclease [Ureibacillus massiliensis 4400831 = CIP 108448 = CCUG 49529]|uniref:Endonuclease n=1 Tax=Ureibacillus massiliensis 4400831 = CIP 108448 = CCUG 49529 TaxID=1211035 RepID=A0A0A3IWK1_9BACL|nr:GIY-YIG nuclease family protein [Ureibacillus massiliensis]KGR89174.1 endonuclease [Ureibacillus massiliensis 4400831 = CIP 108448 = CCUG 49529]